MSEISTSQTLQRFPFVYQRRFLYLGETFSPVQLVGAVVTVIAIYVVNYGSSLE